MISTFW